MPEFKNRSFTEADELTVDGMLFIDCRFTKTHLIYRGGELPGFSNCQLESCQFSFSDAAARTIGYLAFLQKVGASMVVDAVFDEVRRGEIE